MESADKRQQSSCSIHSDHNHEHGPQCGHESAPHGDHTDYLHDGHRHASHAGHWDDHEQEQKQTN